MNDYLFVYGTLMQNHNNYYAQLVQKNSSLIGNGFIYAKKYDLGDYPGIKICNSKTQQTFGEVYQIKNNLNLILKELDYYEGYNSENPKESLFIRKKVTVFTEGANTIKAWVYEYVKKT